MKQEKSDSGKFWPYMILGFLAIGILLGYWTVKSSISLPIRESNQFLMKYQDADKMANQISKAQELFDKRYKISFSGLEKSDFKPKNLKRKPHQYYKLNEINNIKFLITTKDNKAVNDANVTLLLTRPSTTVDDKLINLSNKGKGKYIINDLKINKPGRYILRLRVQKNNTIKFIDIYGYKEK